MNLVIIEVASIYKDAEGNLKNLPKRMGKLTEDAAESLKLVEADFGALGACFRLSDAYRDTKEQAKAHNDFKTGKKKAYSPPAGSSVHEGARAIDIDLAAMIHAPSVPAGYKCIGEVKVREVLTARGWTPVAGMGNPNLVDVSESWHWEFRGPFQKVYDEMLVKTGSRKVAYRTMAQAAIADIQQPVTDARPVLRLTQPPMTGPDVSLLQTKLKAKGYSVAVDNVFGKITESALKQFQGAKGLIADGVCGLHCWVALLKG